MDLDGDNAAGAAQPPKRVQENRIMNVIDFRFRPNTPEIINGIKNSTMFKAACKAIGFDARKPQPLDEIVADLNNLGVELGVITGRDCETTYGFPANTNSVLEFCRAYPFVNEAIYTCLRNANVYMDISEYERAPMVDVYVRAMNDLIPDKILFASAHPFVELADALDAYKEFDLSEEVRRKVMYENARRVLGLS